MSQVEEKLKALRDELGRTALSAEEKARGREMLVAFMAMKPVRAREAVDVRQRTAKPFGFSLFTYIAKPMSVFVMVLAAMLSVGSVSYAAEGALPGDALYPVKVSVNEEVRAALTVSAESRAKWDAERAGRRLAEAETLAARGQLSAEHRATIDAGVRRHSEGAKKRIAEFRRQADASMAAEVSAHFEGSLRAHKKILVALSEETTTELAATIDAETAALVAARVEAQKDFDAETSKSVMAAAENRRRAAENKINEVRSALVRVRSRLGEEAVVEADARLVAAEGVVGEGNAKLEAGENAAAFALYVKAQRMAQEAKLLIRAKANKDLRGKFKLELRLNADDDEDRREEKKDENAEGDDKKRHEGEQADDRDDDRDAKKSEDGVRVQVPKVEVRGDLDIKVGR